MTAPRKSREELHQWVKFGAGRVDRACVRCGLVASHVRTSTRKLPPVNDYPIYTYRRDNLDYGIQKNVPPCAPRFQFDRAPPVTFSMGGYDFSVKKAKGETQSISTQKIGEPESKSPEPET